MPTCGWSGTARSLSSGNAEGQVGGDARVVQGTRRSLRFGQGRARVLQQPLRGLRPRQRERVPPPRGNDGVPVPRREGRRGRPKGPRGFRLSGSGGPIRGPPSVTWIHYPTMRAKGG